jgi:Fe-S oxidoreductase
VDGVVTDCPTCTIQLENLGSLPVYHPIEMVDSWMQ